MDDSSLGALVEGFAYLWSRSYGGPGYFPWYQDAFGELVCVQVSSFAEGGGMLSSSVPTDFLPLFKYQVASWLGYWLFSWVLSFCTQDVLDIMGMLKTWQKGAEALERTLNVPGKEGRTSKKLRKNVKQKNIAEAERLATIWLLTRRQENLGWCKRTEAEIFAPEPEISDMPLRVTDHLPQEDYDFKKVHLIRGSAKRGDGGWGSDAPVGLISRLRNSCSIKYTI